MTSSLSTAAVTAPAEYTLSKDYRVFIETMIPALLADADVRQITVPAEIGYLYRGNLTAYLLDNQIPLEDHYVIQRMNNITHPLEFNETVDYLIVPGISLLGRLKQIYRTKLS